MSGLITKLQYLKTSNISIRLDNGDTEAYEAFKPKVMFLTWGSSNLHGQISLLLKAKRRFYGRRLRGYSSVELENLFGTVFKYVLPGNPAEEWLWFKHCRRKGIQLCVPETTKCVILREVPIIFFLFYEFYCIQFSW